MVWMLGRVGLCREFMRLVRLWAIALVAALSVACGGAEASGGLDASDSSPSPVAQASVQRSEPVAVPTYDMNDPNYDPGAMTGTGPEIIEGDVGSCDPNAEPVGPIYDAAGSEGILPGHLDVVPLVGGKDPAPCTGDPFVDGVNAICLDTRATEAPDQEATYEDLVAAVLPILRERLERLRRIEPPPEHEEMTQVWLETEQLDIDRVAAALEQYDAGNEARGDFYPYGLDGPTPYDVDDEVRRRVRTWAWDVGVTDCFAGSSP